VPDLPGLRRPRPNLPHLHLTPNGETTMDLTWTRGEFNALYGKGENGATLFTINDSMTRGDESAILRTRLPGLREHARIEPPDGAPQYSNAAREKAMRAAAKGLEQWASKVLGVALTVHIVDNT
jgi:hypothetical protein